MATVGPAYEVVGRIAYEFNRLQPFIPTYLHLIASAVFPIYTGAHASLSRPSSAAKAKSSARDDTNGDDGDEEDHEPRMEGLSPSDAIWLPLFAGMTLAGLYFLIKWLEDPALLNKLLNWYFSIFGILSVGKILADAMTLVTSYVFPKRWSSTSTTWHIDEKAQRFIRNRHTSSTSNAMEGQRRSPLPGWMASIPLSSALTIMLWTLRRVLTQLWTLRVKVYGDNLLFTKFGFYDVVGLVIGAIAVAFYNFVSKPWWLTNLMGFGFAYGALQILSPTTFWTGTMILSSLFFYDIYFVFFTPLMVTVATKLDIPIKLLFPRPAQGDQDSQKQQLAMLGLGDVVLPGIMIGLSLRFDLYLYYLRKQRRRLSSQSPVSDEAAATVGNGIEIEKVQFVQASGGWGERFWTRSSGSPLTEGGAFPKTYFHASLVGYVVGMLVTLAVMQIAQHAQPALLYLVPGVFVAIWGTAFVRCEMKEMWQYSENVDDSEVNGQARTLASSSKKVDAEVMRVESAIPGAREEPSTKADLPKSSKRSSGSREVLSVIITAPPHATTEDVDVPAAETAVGASEFVVGHSTSIDASSGCTVPRAEEPPLEKRRRRN